MRALLGGALASRPYRLLDERLAIDVREALRASGRSPRRRTAPGRPAGRGRGERAALLPGSRVPAIIAARARLAGRRA
jgi:hypothetical protein